MLKTCAEILDPKNHFLLLNMYSLSFSSLIAANLIRSNFGQVKKIRSKESCIWKKNRERSFLWGYSSVFQVFDQSLKKMNNRQLFLSHLAQTTDFPLLIEVEKAEGIYLFGPNGEQYIDLISGIGVSNVGHRHPKVLMAIQEQLDKYLHLMVYGEYVQTPQTLLAKALCDTLPSHLDNVYLVNSGSEAIEGALKLAKRYTNRRELISCVDAYHGSSHGALSVGGNEVFKRAYRPLLPGISHIYYGSFSDLEKNHPSNRGSCYRNHSG